MARSIQPLAQPHKASHCPAVHVTDRTPRATGDTSALPHSLFCHDLVTSSNRHRRPRHTRTPCASPGRRWKRLQTCNVIIDLLWKLCFRSHTCDVSCDSLQARPEIVKTWPAHGELLAEPFHVPDENGDVLVQTSPELKT